MSVHLYRFVFAIEKVKNFALKYSRRCEYICMAVISGQLNCHVILLWLVHSSGGGRDDVIRSQSIEMF